MISWTIAWDSAAATCAFRLCKPFKSSISLQITLGGLTRILRIKGIKERETRSIIQITMKALKQKRVAASNAAVVLWIKAIYYLYRNSSYFVHWWKWRNVLKRLQLGISVDNRAYHWSILGGPSLFASLQTSLRKDHTISESTDIRSPLP